MYIFFNVYIFKNIFLRLLLYLFRYYTLHKLRNNENETLFETDKILLFI